MTFVLPETCTRCGAPARHHPHFDGTPLAGWERLCCTHVDVFMLGCAHANEDRQEAVEGLQRWLELHLAECGAR